MENLIGNMINANNKFYFSFFNDFIFIAQAILHSKSYKNPMRYSLDSQVLQY